MRHQRIYVPLTDGAADKLRELARRELRDPRTQAAYLIIAGLRAAGLDPDLRTNDTPAPAPRADLPR